MSVFQPSQSLGKSRQTFKHPTPPPAVHTAMQVNAGAKDIAQQSPVQVDAGAEDNPQDLEKYTVSVPEIAIELQAHGISRSDDTIQRYCREGRILVAVKKGLMRRYHATPNSVEKFIKYLLDDEPEHNRKQVHTGANETAHTSKQLHEGAPQETKPKIKDPHAGASNRTQIPSEQQKESAPSSATNTDLEKELRTQISDKNNQITFLQEELADRRTQTKALEKVIDAFKTNAETAQLEAERKAKQENQKEQSSYTAKVVNDTSEDG